MHPAAWILDVDAAEYNLMSSLCRNHSPNFPLCVFCFIFFVFLNNRDACTETTVDPVRKIYAWFIDEMQTQKIQINGVLVLSSESH